MAYRDFEKAALKRLAEIEKEGDFVTRQKILAARLWAKSKKADEAYVVCCAASLCRVTVTA